MPYQNYPNGLYLLRRPAATKPLDHYAVLDVGNRLGFINADGRQPVVVHQTPPQIRFDWLQDTGIWEVLGLVLDEEDAIFRLHCALQSPDYALFRNNCEHFARFVTTGRHESKQIQATALMAGLAILAYSARSEAS